MEPPLQPLSPMLCSCNLREFELLLILSKSLVFLLFIPLALFWHSDYLERCLIHKYNYSPENNVCIIEWPWTSWYSDPVSFYFLKVFSQLGSCHSLSKVCSQPKSPILIYHFRPCFYIVMSSISVYHHVWFLFIRVIIWPKKLALLLRKHPQLVSAHQYFWVSHILL